MTHTLLPLLPLHSFPPLYCLSLPNGRDFLSLTGSHWQVRAGHSKAFVTTRSYRKGVFFFQILYSSLIIRSCSVMPSVAIADAARRPASPGSGAQNRHECLVR